MTIRNDKVKIIIVKMIKSLRMILTQIILTYGFEHLSISTGHFKTWLRQKE
jgi:hypothetical protein